MTKSTLADLGWSARFVSRLSAEEAEHLNLARIASVARDRLHALTPDGPRLLRPDGPAGDYATGDWVVMTPDRSGVARLIERETELARRAPGTGRARQLIAANVDTLGLVTSCNADFNEARLERYLALAAAAGCLPLVILTKADLCDDPRSYAKRAERLSPMVTAVALDATAPDASDALAAWAGRGQTLALVGSSGVGKTTLSNALTGRADATQDIREDDAKGRHTTTARGLLPTTAGGWLIDTPGMRELGLVDAGAAIDDVFAEIAELAPHCRFSDCAHDGEPGCAVAGAVDPDRLARWRKLKREEARSTETIAEARARDRSFGRMVRSIQSRKDRGRQRE
ncbi:ribosome small subunit-dependent GTPase A [Rhodobacterales bacterium HKCCE3408]|nr:ribosome small subunit-dependent GTPase A [Rhodobacterales bacterium HKCCE3408]